MNNLINYKVTNDDLEVEYEVISIEQTDQSISSKIEQINLELQSLIEESEELDNQIQTLTNNADWIDYTTAVASGIIAGFIDSFFVGQMDFDSGIAWSENAINEFVIKFAKQKGYNYKKGDELKGSIRFLEEKFKVAQDNIYLGKGVPITPRTHHLDDLAHHPTILGLMSSIVVEFFRISVFSDNEGSNVSFKIGIDKEKLIKIWTPIIISGLLGWVLRIVKNNYAENLDKDLPAPFRKLIKGLVAAPAVLKVLEVIYNWFGHLISDIAGSKDSSGAGMGIPGVVISLLKELSMFPILKDTNLPNVLYELYSEKGFDIREEIGVAKELRKQTLPVFINEALVRSVYFIKNLVFEYKKENNFKAIDWKNVIPLGNRTVARMITISSGTFTAFDLADASIRAIIETGGVNPATLGDFALRVNFVGVGRFAIALGTEVTMGIKKVKKESERTELYCYMLELYNAKLNYKIGDTWKTIQASTESIDNLKSEMEDKFNKCFNKHIELSNVYEQIRNSGKEIRMENPQLLKEILDCFDDEWS